GPMARSGCAWCRWPRPGARTWSRWCAGTGRPPATHSPRGGCATWGATGVVVVEGIDQAPVAAARGPGGRGVDILVDATGRMAANEAARQLNPRGRIVLIAGRDRRIELDQWSFYTRELQLLGFVMSAMTEGELAAAAAWINHQHAARPLEVSVGDVMPFSSAALAHTLIERGELPRLPDHTIGRLVLPPDHSL